MPQMKFPTFPKLMFGSIECSKWMKLVSTGIIVYSAYFYLKRTSKHSFYSYLHCVKKLFSRSIANGSSREKETQKNIALKVKELPEHVKYDGGWFDELDELKLSSSDEPFIFSDALLDPLRETTPRGDIIMYYDAETKSFNYYSNSKNIPYSTLDAVARKYVCLYNVPSIYIDIRDEVQKGREKLSKKENALKNEKNERDKNKSANSSSEKKSLFAAFKNYKTGRNAPKSLHNYSGNVKVEEFVVLKNNINKFVYKGTLEQCDADLKSHADQQRTHEDTTLNAASASASSLIKDGGGGSDIIDNLKLIYEKQDLSYADFKKKYNHS